MSPASRISASPSHTTPRPPPLPRPPPPKLTAFADDLFDANAKWSTTQCEEVARSSFEEYVEGAGGGDEGGEGGEGAAEDMGAALEGLKNKFKAMKVGYLEVAKGPAKFTVLSDFQDQKVFTMMKRLTDDREVAQRRALDAQRAKAQEIEERLALKEGAEEVMKHKMENAMSQSTSKVAQIARLDAENASNKLHADQQTTRLRAAQRETEEKQAEADRAQRKGEADMASLAAKLKAANAKAENLEGEKGEMQAAMDAMSAKGGGCCIVQ